MSADIKLQINETEHDSAALPDAAETIAQPSEAEPRMRQLLAELKPQVIQAIDDMGFDVPTPIQRMSIPVILQGKDVMGQAQTGTGKTAAFGIPMVDRIDCSDPRTQALVLLPTRELAMQVARELSKMAQRLNNVRVLTVYGGQPIEIQLRQLKLGAQIVVGTPGRVIDHLQRGTLTLDNVRYLVLDEADEMLDMGFRDDIQTILEKVPAERQTLLFSATMPRIIMALAQRYLNKPVFIKAPASELTVNTVEQVYVEVMPGQKAVALSRLLDMYAPELTLVFVNTKAGVEDVVTYLQKQGFSAGALHGDMKQIERDNIMARFRAGILKVLVATDVAARGLDVQGIEAVFNYDIPQDVDQYVHRIGRTGRAGHTGKAFTFVVGRELAWLWEIRRATKAKILLEKAPLKSSVIEKRTQRFTAQLMDAPLLENDVNLQTAKALLEKFDAADVIAHLLRQCVRDVDGPEDLTPVHPKPAQPRARMPYGQPRAAESAQPGQGRRSQPAGQPHDRRNYGQPYNRNRQDRQPYGRSDRGRFDEQRGAAPQNRQYPARGKGAAAQEHRSDRRSQDRQRGSAVKK